MPPSPTPLRILRRSPKVAGPAGGERVVMVHGSMDRATSFTRLMGRLRDWSIVAYDRRGYAGSAGVGPPTSFADQVGDLVEVLGGSPTVAFGHSFGGTVVLAAAATHPELIPAALVWEPPLPWLPGWPRLNDAHGADHGGPPAERTGPDDRADRAERFMRRTVGDRIWERLPASTRAQRRAEGHTLHAEMISLADAPAFDAAAVTMPVIVGRGGHSSEYQRQAASQLAAELRGGQLADIADAGHGAHLTHPGQVADLLRLLLAQHRDSMRR